VSSELSDVSSLEEAAAYLRLSPDKLRRMARAKQIGHIKTGRQYLFPRAAVESYVRDHTVDPLPSGVPPWGVSERSLVRLRREGRERLEHR
jgi:excisionase family DNA binding protein